MNVNLWWYVVGGEILVFIEWFLNDFEDVFYWFVLFVNSWKDCLIDFLEWGGSNLRKKIVNWNLCKWIDLFVF